MTGTARRCSATVPVPDEAREAAKRTHRLASRSARSCPATVKAEPLSNVSSSADRIEARSARSVSKVVLAPPRNDMSTPMASMRSSMSGLRVTTLFRVSLNVPQRAGKGHAQPKFQLVDADGFDGPGRAEASALEQLFEHVPATLQRGNEFRMERGEHLRASR